MSEDKQIIAVEQSTQAIEAARKAAEENEKSRIAQLEAVLEPHREKTAAIIHDNYTSIMIMLQKVISIQESSATANDLAHSITNEHLAKLNGKIAEHEKNLSLLMLWKAQAKGFGEAINLGWSSFIGLFGGGVALIIYWFTRK